MRRPRLRLQILLPVLIAMLISGIGALAIGEWQLRRLVMSGQDRIGQERLTNIRQLLLELDERLQQTGLTQQYRKEFQGLALRRLRGTYLDPNDPAFLHPLIIDNQDHFLLGGDHPEAQTLRRHLSGDSANGSWLRHDGQRWWVQCERFEPWAWRICYLTPERERFRDVAEFRVAFGLLLLSLLISTSIGLIWFINRTLRPINSLTRAATAMANGNLDVSLDAERPDELGILNAAFDSMRIAVREQMAAKDHELHERRLAEEALRRSEGDLAITLNSIADAVLACDAKGVVTRCNGTASQLLQQDSEQILGRDLHTVLPLESETPPIADPTWLQTVFTHGIGFTQSSNVQLRAASGHRIPIDVSVAPIRNEHDAIGGCVLVFRDIGERLQLEEQLRQSQKMDAIGQLAGGVAHDFNNMLAAIQGASELLKAIPATNDRQKRLLTTISTACDRASGLTGKLLAFGRKGRKDSRPVDLHQLIQQTCDMLARTIDRRIVINHDFQAECVVVDGDASMLHNALLNLGINARDAMPHGGELRYETSNRTLESGEHPELDAGTYLTIRVRDTGVGIPEELRSRIFEPFFTTKKAGQGTGLGLAAVYGTTHEHHGAIDYTSTPGVGTCFEVLLPCQELEPQRPTTLTQIPTQFSGTVLLVDDEDIIRQVIRHLLEDMGLQVLEATDGESGLERYRAEGDRIDLCIIDMIMPSRDGADLFRSIRAINPEAKVVLMSGYAGDQRLDALRAEGLLAFIQKPAPQERLRAILTKAFG